MYFKIFDQLIFLLFSEFLQSIMMIINGISAVLFYASGYRVYFLPHIIISCQIMDKSYAKISKEREEHIHLAVAIELMSNEFHSFESIHLAQCIYLKCVILITDQWDCIQTSLVIENCCRQTVWIQNNFCGEKNKTDNVLDGFKERWHIQ